MSKAFLLVLCLVVLAGCPMTGQVTIITDAEYYVKEQGPIASLELGYVISDDWAGDSLDDGFSFQITPRNVNGSFVKTEGVLIVLGWLRTHDDLLGVAKGQLIINSTYFIIENNYSFFSSKRFRAPFLNDYSPINGHYATVEVYFSDNNNNTFSAEQEVVCIH